MSHIREKTQRTVVNSATNAAATATQAGQAGKRHYITGYSVSVRGTTPAVGTFEVRSAANVLVRLELPAAQISPIDLDLHNPLECGVGEDATATVTGMGATQTATVVIKTRTENE